MPCNQPAGFALLTMCRDLQHVCHVFVVIHEWVVKLRSVAF